MKNIKGKEYTIIPMMDGQLNLFYFELLADKKDKDGNIVGFWVVDLLPGVYNETNPIAAFDRVQ